jgi:poly(3-hydroxybutyrate) depolymerase
MRRDFGISEVMDDGRLVQIRRRDMAWLPFCILSEFASTPGPQDRVLLIAPLSGHFSYILREMVLGFLPDSAVYVTDWLDARFVPQSAGDFGFDENIGVIVESIRRLGPGVDVCALCQAVVPALAATAVIAQQDPCLAPRSLILIGGPVDPLANPTRVVRLLRQKPLSAIAASALDRVAPAFPGGGRLVYPAMHQLSALLAYYYRHVISGGELLSKTLDDDGLDPLHFPFFALFTTLMDLPAKYFLENIETVFLERQPCTGQLRWHGRRVDFAAIRDTALMTIEGEHDDIAAPGQTSAAHRLCPNIPSGMRRRVVQRGAGHFSLFYGRTWRERILPEINAFRQMQSMRPRLLPLGRQAPLSFELGQRAQYTA